MNSNSALSAAGDRRRARDNGPTEDRSESSRALLRSSRESALDIRAPVGIFTSAEGRYAVSLSDEDYPDALKAASRVRSSDAGKDAGPTLIAVLPAVYPEWLGTRRFTAFHGCRFPYAVGAMARGITTARMVVAAAQHGLLGFFGAAGLRPTAVADGIQEIENTLEESSIPDAPWGTNLIHSPDHPDRERDMVDLYIRHRVRRISASAFMQLSPEIVRLSASGLHLGRDGEVARGVHVFAKVSRPEVAKQFMAPPPAELLRELAAAGRITEQQADLQSRLPVAEDITVEADSGGHTDNRPLPVVFPIIAMLRDEISATHNYDRPIRLGAAGGIGTPQAVAAGFQLGADYVLTGSINQAAVESGLSAEGRLMLADCGMADVTMAPAADMFERGVKVQVLRKGTMFAVKAQRLFDLYRRHEGLETLPAQDRQWLESQVLKESCGDAWARAREHLEASDPAAAATAERDPKRQMALVFRRYLFMGAQWAREGSADRRLDYQIWCGPAMGSFNDWARGSFLETAENRTVGQIALNLLEGACLATRIQQLQMAGVDTPNTHSALSPRRLTLG